MRRNRRNEVCALRQPVAFRLRSDEPIKTKSIEKLEDARAKAAIKAQIEADKRERASKVAREKALREGQTLPEQSTSTSPTRAPVGPASGVAGKDFKETRLQIRMASGGAPYTITMSSDASTYTRLSRCV
jgi:hypothetical protein